MRLMQIYHAGDRLHMMENSVCRKILGASSYKRETEPLHSIMPSLRVRKNKKHEKIIGKIKYHNKTVEENKKTLYKIIQDPDRNKRHQEMPLSKQCFCHPTELNWNKDRHPSRSATTVQMTSLSTTRAQCIIFFL